MRIKIPVLAATLFAAALLPAQQDPEPQVPDPAARIEALQKEEQALVKKWRDQQRAAMEAARKARESGSNVAAPAMSMRPDFSSLVPKYEAAAADYAETDDAIPFLLWILQRGGDRESSGKVVDTLATHHAASPALADFGQMLPYLPRMVEQSKADALMKAIDEQSKDANMLAWVAIARFGPIVEEAATDSEKYAAAKAELLEHKAAASDKRIKTEIQSKIDLREKLGVGATAPDIEGVDLDGESFKLSDYRGKVIFLDFWGDW